MVLTLLSDVCVPLVGVGVPLLFGWVVMLNGGVCVCDAPVFGFGPASCVVLLFFRVVLLFFRLCVVVCVVGGGVRWGCAVHLSLWCVV